MKVPRPTTTHRSVTFEDKVKDHSTNHMHAIITQAWDDDACGEHTPECGLLMAHCVQQLNQRLIEACEIIQSFMHAC